MVACHNVLVTRLREYHEAFIKAQGYLADWDTAYKARVKERDEAETELKKLKGLEAKFEERVAKKAEELSAPAIQAAETAKKAAEETKARLEKEAKVAKEKADAELEVKKKEIDEQLIVRLKDSVNLYLESAEGRAEHRELALRWLKTEEGQKWFVDESLPTFDLGQKSFRQMIIDRGDSYDLSWSEELFAPA